MNQQAGQQGATARTGDRDRMKFLAIGALGAIVFIALGGLLPIDSRAAMVLFDHRENGSPPYPINIACIEWLIFGLGLGEVARHQQRARGERAQLNLSLLPEDEEVMLDNQTLQSHTRGIKASATRPFRLQRLLLRTIWQFQSSRSVAQASGVMDATLELCQHELDLQYNLSRYFAWLLPTIGFIGTVWGLSMGLGRMANNKKPPTDPAYMDVIRDTTHDLSLAFNTTFLALVLSSILVFLMQIIQEKEEHALNDAGQYCLDHLINKFYVR